MIPLLTSSARAGLLLLFVAAVAAAPLHAQVPDAPPNLVVILADDLGYGDLSSYGASDVRTPHVDALVAGGLRFDAFYANAPVCSPTRASLLTGRYPDLVGVPGVIRVHARDSWGYLDPEARLLPAVLRGAGYHTALVGKWHLGLEAPNRPQDRGFDVFHGFLGDMMDDYYHHRRFGLNFMRRGDEPIEPEGHATDLFTDWAVDYIHERAGSEAPFFLFLAYNAPHTPIQPPPEWLERVRAREPEISEERARLVALIEHMDAGVGRVVEALEAAGVRDETLVVFTSDNGGQLNVGADNGPWRGGKQEMYEGGLRVPAAVVWPGRVAPGTRTDAVALTMDLFPTLLDAAGISLHAPVDGRSLRPLLEGGPAPEPDRALVFTRREGGDWYMGQTVWAVRRGDWKLVKNAPGLPFRLYDLAADPGETTDVAGAHPEVFRELGEALRLHVRRGGSVPWQRR